MNPVALPLHTHAGTPSLIALTTLALAPNSAIDGASIASQNDSESFLSRFLQIPSLIPDLPLHVWTCDLQLQMTAILYPAESAGEASSFVPSEFDWLSEEAVLLVKALQR